jgi:hypothetical protein
MEIKINFNLKFPIPSFEVRAALEKNLHIFSNVIRFIKIGKPDPRTGLSCIFYNIPANRTSSEGS